MRHRRLTAFAAALTIVASCTSRDASSDSARTGAGAADTSAAVVSVPWFDSTAPLLLVPAHSNDRALVVPADSLAPDLEEGALAEPASLLALDGAAATVRVSLSSGSEGCVDAALTPAPSKGWGVGFVGRAPRGLRVDSLGSIPRQDSAALAPIVFRLASTVPNTVARFKGLPFSLLQVWRMRAPDGARVIVATTRRQINQEDSPLEERTLIVAEADSSGANYRLVHSERATGPEETVEGTDLLAAVSFGSGATELVFTHDFGNETAYSILERVGSTSWSQRWASRRFSC